MASEAQAAVAGEEAASGGGCGWTALISGWEDTPTLLTVKNCGEGVWPTQHFPFSLLVGMTESNSNETCKKLVIRDICRFSE
jgi:hypothetical protein